MAASLALPALADEIVLPGADGGAAARAASIKVEATPRPDGALDARVTLALVGGAAAERLSLTLPELPLVAVDVAGKEIPPPQGVLEVGLAAGEAVSVRLTFRVEPDELDWVPAIDAGWAGRTRGPLLQPARRVVIRHAEGSGLAGAPVSARIVPGGDLPVAALLQSPPGRLAQGEASWEGVVLPTGGRLVLTWPLLEGALLPRDRAEAEALAEDLLQRDVAGLEYERTRDAIASSGEPGAATAASVLAALGTDRARRLEAAEKDRRRREQDEARRVASRQADEREKAARDAKAQADRETDREAAAREAKAREDREVAAREAKTQVDREAAAREVQAQAGREAAAREAKAQADREAAAREVDRVAAARDAKAQADREEATLDDRADREAAAHESQAAADREAAALEARAQADRDAADQRARARADREATDRLSPEHRQRLEDAAAEIAARQRREQLARALAASQSGGVPWIRSADAARLYVETMSTDPLKRQRIEEAVAVVRAHWGEPFLYELRWQRRFAQEPWYAPRREDALLPATEGEIAALEVLARALD